MDNFYNEKNNPANAYYPQDFYADKSGSAAGSWQNFSSQNNNAQQNFSSQGSQNQQSFFSQSNDSQQNFSTQSNQGQQNFSSNNQNQQSGLNFSGLLSNLLASSGIDFSQMLKNNPLASILSSGGNLNPAEILSKTLANKTKTPQKKQITLDDAYEEL